MESFGERLESLRKGRTQKEFASSLGLPINTYTNWVRGIREPSMNALLNICTRLGVSCDWLIGLTEERGKAATVVDASHNAGSIAIGGGNAVSRDCLECPLLQAHLKRFSTPKKNR